MRSILLFSLTLFTSILGSAQDAPRPVSGEFLVKDFKFETGETLPELKLHYVTLGTPRKDQNGRVTNAVIINHGTGGSHTQFLGPGFAGVLFGKGQPLDAEKYFIVLPDNIGHGRSSKPSNGLRAKFPRYCYHDMIRAQHRLLTEKLGVNHLRLVTGTSMGGMHTWLWTGMYPEFMDAAMPLASLPVEIAGRNRFFRRMVIDPIRNDPEWQNGEYKMQPVRGLTTALYTLIMMTSSPLQMQKQMPTKAAADTAFDQRIRQMLANYDANDMLYHFDASRDYNPEPDLEKIKARVLAINSADDVVNPPELGIMEQQIKRIKNARFILLPISDQTRGHGTHTVANLWKHHLADFMIETERK